MKLVRNQKYGFPYQGSKDKIVPSIAAFLPPADNFYDLFGGGASMTHYMMLRRPDKYKNFIYNDILPGNGELLRRAISGEFNYDRFKPAFISRDEFFENKDSDPYIKVIWSFGNNQKTYLFNREIEPYKKSLHNAVVFGVFDSTAIKVIGLSLWPKNFKSITKRRLYVRQRVKYLTKKPEQLQQLERLEQLERLQQLEQLEQLERLERFTIYSKSYDKIDIKPNSVIYCDPPYKGTADYLTHFDHRKFLDWVATIKAPVYISEYEIKDERFKLVYEVEKKGLFAHRKATRSIKVERLYWNGK